MSDFDIRAAATRIHHQYSARRRQALARRERAQAFGRSLARFLRAELAQDLEFIQENYDKNRRMSRRIDTTESPDEFDYAALGYTLHNLYNAFEAYFLRVAKFFENNLEASAWHKSLLDRMTLHVPGIRQAVVDRALAERLRELMRFRHLFRNLYKSQLLPDKVTSANGYAEGIAAAFTEHHQRFDTFLAALADDLRTKDQP